MAPVHAFKSKCGLAAILACTVAQSTATSAFVALPPEAEEGDSQRVVTEVSLASSKSLLLLNSVTFKGNINANSATAEHWFVMFCVNWWETCQTLRETFSQQASVHERNMNSDALLLPPVRFAEVDCAVDKVLCNEQSVEDYPTIAHYHTGSRTSSWTINNRDPDAQARRIIKYLKEETMFQTSPEGSLDGSFQDSAHMPHDEPDIMETAMRVVPYAVAAVGLGIWIITQGVELFEKVKGPGDEKLESEKTEVPQLHEHMYAACACQRQTIEL